MSRRTIPLLAAFVVAVLPTLAFAQEANPTVVRPREIDDLLVNPGMGWQTFHQFVVHDKNLKGLPSSSAYYRFYWSEIEPRDGEPDFEKLDGLLALGRRVGQKLALRVMVVGSGAEVECPLWLKEAGCKGAEYEYDGKKHWFPDFADPIFQAKHFALVRALGARYDGHPDLDLVDIGTVGMWGEWHLGGVKDPRTQKEVAMPSEEVQNKIIDEWVKAFPKTPKVMLIGSDVGMARAPREDFGWRADCFGDMGGFSKNWNHMQHMYRQQITKSKAEEVWKTAPVAFESCWDARRWVQEGWNVREIFDYGLDLHASYLNNKSAPLPEEIRPEVERFLRKLGYRLVIRRLEHEPTATAGAKLRVAIDWENVGVAPPYRDYRVALRLTRLGDATAKPIVLVGEESIRGWLPGERKADSAFALPASAAAGDYELAVGIVEPSSSSPAVRLAIAGRDESGWYPLSKIAVSE